ncbi:LPO_1073/Vpar_1526 family protein [Aliivibrio fischeri]|uniref:LPO_1073/Vpar_1526 family protein n=1 Tax=Aliivibrio fischeri TaxID=668 RepID=UPI0007C4F1DF|nr:LPO_1073/Vpar_1526 family protein [Aliivibrio fischeri]MBP3157158.1 hypothetical protein [Aliivibrio fischeri]MCE7575230.1 hypothetical protein [Aliivibrio fischeri]
MTEQIQKGGIGSTNIQAQDIHIVNGLSYPEVRQVALDVFKSNFYELAGEAKNIAQSRAEEITEQFLNKLKIENPSGFTKSQDPDFQHALYTVQKEFARNGDEDLGSLLVDLLVDRSKQEQRDILQIVLNESLAIAPKLPNNHLNVLAIVFLFRYTQNTKVNSIDALGNFLDQHVKPFVNYLPTSDASYQHLEFAGCATASMGNISLEDILGNIYQGLFMKGISREEIESSNLSIGFDSRFFIPCLNNKDLFQVAVVSNEVLKDTFEQFSIIDEDKRLVTELFNKNKMSSTEIKEKCIYSRPYMEEIFKVWSTSPMKSLNLTSVGIAIGHANIKRLVGKFSDLSIWIN